MEEAKETAHIMMTNGDNLQILSPTEDNLMLEAGAEAAGLPGSGLSAEESAAFPDVLEAPPATRRLFLYLRNKMLLMWMQDCGEELTLDGILASLPSPYNGEVELTRRIFGFLSRYGFVNYGCFRPAIPPSAPSPGRPRKSKKVLILGAGLAGLTAARQLRHFGFQVKVLEVRGRVGGRVATYRNNGSAVDLGAHAIHALQGNPLNVLVKQLGLELEKLRMKCPLFDIDGTLVDRGKNDIIERELFRLVQGAKYLSKEMGMKVDPRSGDPLSLADAIHIIMQLQEQKVKEKRLEYWTAVLEQQEKLKTAVNQLGDCRVELESVSRRRRSDEERMENAEDPAMPLFVSRYYQRQQEDLVADYGKLEKHRKDLSDIILELNSDFPSEVYMSGGDRRMLDWHVAGLEALTYAPLSDLSLAHWDSADGYARTGAHYTVKGGMGKLAQGMAEGLDILTNAQVEHVELTDNGAIVTWSVQESVGEEEGSPTRRRKSREEADAVLCTLPLGVLKHSLAEPASPTAITFTPPLPPPKVAAIENLGFGVLNKVVLTFQKIFWDPNIHVYGHINQEESHRGELFLFWNQSGAEESGSLVGLIAGESGEWGERVPDNIIVGRALKVLAEMFGASAVAYPRDTVVTRWRADTWSRGSGTYIGKAASEAEVAALSEPVRSPKANGGGLFFAGEATCRNHLASMEGAVLSGVREAGRIADALLPSTYAP